MLRNAALASPAREANTAGRLAAGGRARERSRCIPGCLLAVLRSLSTDAASIKEKSGDYCAHCYQDGAFTWDCTMDEMIEFCLRFELQRTPSLDKAAARARMRQQFLTLKRWRARPGT